FKKKTLLNKAIGLCEREKEMVEKKNKFDLLLKAALSGSPYSRDYHQSYFGKHKEYVYGLSSQSQQEAVTIVKRSKEAEGNARQCVILDVEQAAGAVMRGVHQSLVTVHQDHVIYKTGLLQKQILSPMVDAAFMETLRHLQVMTLT